MIPVPTAVPPKKTLRSSALDASSHFASFAIAEA